MGMIYFLTFGCHFFCKEPKKKSNHILGREQVTCFGQIYWPSSGSNTQQCLNLELSHAVTTVVFTIIKITQIRLLLKYSWNIIKIQLHTL
jgi:hypothetical protein